jgi:hypothetical protein
MGKPTQITFHSPPPNHTVAEGTAVAVQIQGNPGSGAAGARRTGVLVRVFVRAANGFPFDDIIVGPVEDQQDAINTSNVVPFQPARGQHTLTTIVWDRRPGAGGVISSFDELEQKRRFVHIT